MSKLVFPNLTASNALKAKITGEPSGEQKPTVVVRSEVMDSKDLRANTASNPPADAVKQSRDSG